ncbi:MAG: hypothetical protein ACE5DW_00330 [Thermodesulfobacteriota bacterium]
MNPGFNTWKDGLFLCLLAGALWGMVSLLVNTFTGAFTLEASLVHDLVTFTLGGALFGLVTGGLLSVLQSFMPGRGLTKKAVMVSVVIWLALNGAGFVLSVLSPIRYHFEAGQSLQGLFLAAILGIILGTFWKMGLKAGRAEAGA